MTASIKLLSGFIFFFLIISLQSCSNVLVFPLATDNAEREILQTEYEYVEHIFKKIEIIGASRYPELQNMIDSATSIDVEIEINNNGRLLQTRILRPSNNKRLDAAIIDIIQYSAPYPPFEDDMKIEAIIIQKRWSFTSK